MAPFANKPLLLFGGSFDPVHQAHLDVALAASAALGNARVMFVPNARSPLKQHAGASAEQRLTMLTLALREHAQCSISRQEIDRPAPSWTIDTLRHIKQQHPALPLVLIMGADSFASLHRWKDWQAFNTLCHLLVLPRPQAAQPDQAVLDAFAIGTREQLCQHPAGFRLMLDAPQVDLSSTHIRQQVAQGDTSGLLDSIKSYVAQQRIYL